MNRVIYSLHLMIKFEKKEKKEKKIHEVYSQGINMRL